MKLVRGISLVEVVVAVVVVSILAALITVVVGRVGRTVKDATCRSNLLALGRAVEAYAADWDGSPPQYTTSALGKIDPATGDTYRTSAEPGPWKACLIPYVKSKEQFYCPFDENAGTKKVERGDYGRTSEFTSYEHVPWITGRVSVDGYLTTTLEIERDRGEAGYIQDRTMRVYDFGRKKDIYKGWHGEKINIWFLTGKVQSFTFEND